MTHSIDYRYQSRDTSNRYVGGGFVVVLHILVVGMIVTGTAQRGIKLLTKPLEAVVIQEVFIPPPPPPPPPPVPKEARPPEANAPRVDSPQPYVPAPEVIPQTPSTAPSILATQVPPLAPPVIAPAPPAPPVENAKAQAASLELEYILKVRAMLHSTKRYPTGRQASQQRPQGKVKLWFTLTRHGALVEVGILESSNSNLLDDAAIATVRRGSYEPFPFDTWVGEEQHKFSAEITFAPPSS